MDLISKIIIPVKFSDTDAMGVVWHGNYLRFMEDGREDFGAQHNLRYLDVYAAGLMTPVVDLKIHHRRFLKYGESVEVETKFIESPAAKLKFEYILRETKSGDVAAKASTTQVFVDLKGQLLFTKPDFYLNWLKQHNLLK